LGIKAVIAESYERIHRSNLIGMGVLPLAFAEGVTRKTLGLKGDETFDLVGLGDGVEPAMEVSCRISRSNGRKTTIALRCRIDTLDEVAYYRHGGILHYVLRDLLARAA